MLKYQAILRKRFGKVEMAGVLVEEGIEMLKLRGVFALFGLGMRR